MRSFLSMWKIANHRQLDQAPIDREWEVGWTFELVDISDETKTRMVTVGLTTTAAAAAHLEPATRLAARTAGVSAVKACLVTQEPPRVLIITENGIVAE